MSNVFDVKHPECIYAGGEWVAATGGQFELVNPATETPFLTVADASTSDVDRAVAAGRAAFDHGDWPRYSPAQRAACLRRLAEELAKRQTHLEQAFIQQVGGLCSFAPIAVSGATATIARYADIAEHYAWEEEQACSLPQHKALLLRDPVGVVAAICPWNMPYSIMAQKIAPALAAGCTVVMKPAPETPLEAFIIAQAAEAAGFPPGVINLLPANRDSADYLVRHPGIDKISFTGSTMAGKRIGSVAAERVARVTLELGGKSPAIVLDDISDEQAAATLAFSATILSGQVCALLSRAIVPADRHERIAELIVEHMRAIKVGMPTDPTTQMGPIAMRRQLERVQSYIEIGVKEGAQLMCGGKRPPDLENGYFIEPTLFAHVDNSMRIAQEEIFGPVLCLIPANDEEHAIEIANDTSYGLNSAVFTSSPERVREVGRRLRAGNVAQNGMKADFCLPFGGFKQSGVGREGGVEGIMPYVETKTILMECPDAHAGDA